jgi:hypothetical protein
MATAILPSSTIFGTDFSVTYRNPDADDAENPPPDRWAEGREGSNALYGLFRRLLARPS